MSVEASKTSEALHASEWRARHMATIAAVRAALRPQTVAGIERERAAPEFAPDGELGQKLRSYAVDCIGIRREDADDVVGFACLLTVAAVSIALANAVIDAGGSVTLLPEEATGESRPVDRSDVLHRIDQQVAEIVMVSAGLALELRCAAMRAMRNGTLRLHSIDCAFGKEGLRVEFSSSLF